MKYQYIIKINLLHIITLWASYSFGQADIALSFTNANTQGEIGDTVHFQLVAHNLGAVAISEIEVALEFSSALNISMTTTPANTTYILQEQLWRIQGNLSPQDSLVLGLAFEVLQPSTHLVQAEVVAMNEIDVNSTPNNQDPLENDQTGTCIIVPILIDVATDSVLLVAPNQLSFGHRWIREVNGNQQIVSTAATFVASEPGHYFYEQDGAICSGEACCPVIIEAEGTCNALLISLDCHDSGTIDDSSDDLFTAVLQFDRSSMLPNASYLIEYNNTILNGSGSPFNVPTTISSPDFMADGQTEFTLALYASDDSECSRTILFTAPEPCSFLGDCDFYASVVPSNCCNTCEEGNLKVVTAYWEEEFQFLESANLALGKPTLFNGNPQTGADFSHLTTDGLFQGNNGNAFDYAFSPTGLNNHWNIDLYGHYDLETLRIYPKSGSNFSNANQYRILVSNNPFMSNNLSTALNQIGVTSFTLPITNGVNPIVLDDLNVQGRFVRVYQEGLGRMKLVEVEIIGSGNGNSRPYQYEWSDDQIGNSPMPSCLAPGIYQVMISDMAKGCQITKEIEVN